MKKYYILFLLFLASFNLSAKYSYVPIHFTSITLEENNQLYHDSTFTHDLALSPQDKRFTIYVLYDTLTEQRVKAIKRQKTAMVLAGISLAASCVSAATTFIQTPLTPLDAKWQAINYTNSVSLTGSAAYLMASAETDADVLSKMPISIIIQNNSDRELYINDMSRGLVWYIRAYGELTLSVGNPEINRFRIAYADTTDPQVCYAMIEACNSVESFEAEFEDIDYWYYGWHANYSGSQMIVSFFRMDKVTKQRVLLKMNEKEAKQFRKERR